MKIAYRFLVQQWVCDCSRKVFNTEMLHRKHVLMWFYILIVCLGFARKTWPSVINFWLAGYWLASNYLSQEAYKCNITFHQTTYTMKKYILVIDIAYCLQTSQHSTWQVIRNNLIYFKIGFDENFFYTSENARKEEKNINYWKWETEWGKGGVPSPNIAETEAESPIWSCI